MGITIPLNVVQTLKWEFKNTKKWNPDAFFLPNGPAPTYHTAQYHPEAGPGPHDSRYLFKQF